MNDDESEVVLTLSKPYAPSSNVIKYFLFTILLASKIITHLKYIQLLKLFLNFLLDIINFKINLIYQQ